MNELTELKLQEIFETIARIADDCSYEIEAREDIDITKVKINIKLERVKNEIAKINHWLKGECE